MNYTKKSSYCKQNPKTFLNLSNFPVEKEAPLVENKAPQENLKDLEGGSLLFSYLITPDANKKEDKKR